jgi:receptor-type tyrosine-protein phosphatase gamma
LSAASLIGLLVVVSLLFWRKYFQAAYYYLDEPANSTLTRGSSPQMTESYDDELDVGCTNNMHTSASHEYPHGEQKSIPVSLWAKHVQNLHADGDLGFSREYEAIQAASNDSTLTCQHSQMLENKAKNRYVNIVAYDHSRVAMKPVSVIKKQSNDYINANFIDGYGRPRAYIGTQGPLPCTFDDYWRMIWEQRVCIIVMITNLIERGRRKCDLYWPKEGVETYGAIQVKLLQEVVMATYILRTFSIVNTKVKKKQIAERTVYQYHYTNWPDHGVPDHPLPVLSFVRKSAAANPPNGGPIIVHCSAGVGRTGTYIVIEAMLKQIRQRASVNVYGFLKHIRTQRNYLVQTEEQYVFIHDALLEAIESSDTEVPSTLLSRYIQQLQTGGDQLYLNDSFSDLDLKKLEQENTEQLLNSTLHWPLLERQYKLVTSFRAKDFNVISALKQCNKGKNRSLNLIPLEAHRVHITPRTPGQEGSDYINATFLPGFSQLNEFIVTQHPLLDTVVHFWQMIWDHNVQQVVSLSAVLDEKQFPQYWPEQGKEVDYGSFKLRLISEQALVQSSGCVLTCRQFILHSNQDDYELTCRLVHCPGWPETCGPLSNVFDLVREVQQPVSPTIGCAGSGSGTGSSLSNPEGSPPVVVVDKYGGSEAATFCCLATLYKQLNFEDCVDVYMYSKLYHLRRPGIWRTQDDYLFLYRAAECMVSQLGMGGLTERNSFDSQLNVSSCSRGELNVGGDEFS